MDSFDDAAARDAHRQRLLAQARADFPAFYLNADALDAGCLDSFLLAAEAAAVLSVLWRDKVRVPLRAHLEIVSDKVDQVHAACREAVRGCRTFQTLPKEVQELILNSSRLA